MSTIIMWAVVLDTRQIQLFTYICDKMWLLCVCVCVCVCVCALDCAVLVCVLKPGRAGLAHSHGAGAIMDGCAPNGGKAGAVLVTCCRGLRPEPVIRPRPACLEALTY